MATGLLVRDFFKEYRELRYTSSGSIRLTEIEHNAYRNSLTLEVTHIETSRYENVKTLPSNSHFGYATSFKGSTVSDSISIKYPKFRVFDIRNNGIWNYHELTESKQLQSTEVAESVSYGTDVVGLVFDWVLDSVGEAWEFLFGGSSGGSGESYRAFPVASPFPDVVKFKSDVPVSFLFRLESWYLVNPVVYVTDNPTDSGDETEGEDEYPTPSDEPFPPQSPGDPESDPRDYTGGLPGEIPFEGGQCPGVAYAVAVRMGGDISPPISVNNYSVTGPIRGIRVSSSVLGGQPFREYFLRSGEPEVETPLGGLFVTIESGSPPITEENNPVCEIVGVTRNDGLPDNCGNPLPIVS